MMPNDDGGMMMNSNLDDSMNLGGARTIRDIPFEPVPGKVFAVTDGDHVLCVVSTKKHGDFLLRAALEQPFSTSPEGPDVISIVPSPDMPKRLDVVYGPLLRLAEGLDDVRLVGVRAEEGTLWRDQGFLGRCRVFWVSF